MDDGYSLNPSFAINLRKLKQDKYKTALSFTHSNAALHFIRCSISLAVPTVLLNIWLCLSYCFYVLDKSDEISQYS